MKKTLNRIPLLPLAIVAVAIVALIPVMSTLGSDKDLSDTPTQKQVIALDGRGRAIYIDEHGNVHGRLRKGFLGFGWKIVPEQRTLTESEYAKASEHEAKLAKKRAEYAARAAAKAEAKAKKLREREQAKNHKKTDAEKA